MKLGQLFGLIIIVLVFIALIGMWYYALYNSRNCDRDCVETCWCGHVHYHSSQCEGEKVEYEDWTAERDQENSRFRENFIFKL
jgi:hypothetical protein